jgi:hypothetical protein
MDGISMISGLSNGTRLPTHSFSSTKQRCCSQRPSRFAMAGSSSQADIARKAWSILVIIAPIKAANCVACAQLAARGTPEIRYRYVQATVRCDPCMFDPERRRSFVPPLDDDGSEDDLDTCLARHGEHRDDGSCHYIISAVQADAQWRYATWRRHS